MKNSKSFKAFKIASNLMPGGVNSPVRAFKSVGLPPVIVKSGRGSRIYDIDGNEYIDYVMSYGPMILGHADKRVVRAVKTAAEKGFSFGATTEGEIELAGLIKKHLPLMEMVRLVNSGTEAVMSALRLARGYTKRDKIIKFEGCYHGHSDSMLVKAGSGALTTSVPSSPGVSACISGDTLVAAYNDLGSVKSIFKKNKGKIAAVIIEPVAANMGVVLPEGNFLRDLIDISHEEGSLAIFDEVITGFRVGAGGAQGFYNAKPDITCLGKIIGGGLPIGAFGGSKKIMEHISPSGPVYQAGTLSGNPVCVEAGIATLKAIEEDDAVNKASNITDNIMEGLKDGLKGSGILERIRLNRISSLFTIFFKRGSVIKYEDVMKSDTRLFGRFFKESLNRGLFIAPSQYEAMFVSSRHTKKDCDKTVSIILEGLRKTLKP